MTKRIVILLAPIPQRRDEGSEAKDLSVTPPLRSRQRWIVFPIFYFLFSIFAFLP